MRTVRAFTPREDAELLRRKAAGESWGAIGIALDRDGSSLRCRYARLCPDARKGTVPRPFTPEEDADLLRRKAAGEFWRVIARALGRHHAVLRDRYRKLLTPSGGSRAVVHLEIPEEVLADRDARAVAPRSLTAMVCGDPPPGRSALDQRQGQWAPPLYPRPWRTAMDERM